MALFAERCPKTAVSRSQSSNQTLAASALFRIVRQTNEGRHSAFGIKLDNVRVVGFKVTTLETKDTLCWWSLPSEEALSSNQDFQIVFPMEVRKSWQEMVTRLGTYAQGLFAACLLRTFALVIAVSHMQQC